MKQIEFEEQLAALMDLPRKTVSNLVYWWTLCMTLKIASGDVTILPRFGKWYVQVRQGKNIFNPYYGTIIHYSARNIIKFRSFLWSGKRLAPDWRPYLEVNGVRIYPQCDIAMDMNRLAEIDLLLCNRFIYELVDQLIYITETDNTVSFNNFGTVSRYFNKAHDGRNPHTGVTISIPARYKIRFKAAKLLKDRVN